MWVFQFKDKIKKKKKNNWSIWATKQSSISGGFFQKATHPCGFHRRSKSMSRNQHEEFTSHRFAQNFFNKSVARGMHCMRHTNDARHAISRNVSSFCLHFQNCQAGKRFTFYRFPHSNLISLDHLWTWKTMNEMIYNLFITVVYSIFILKFIIIFVLLIKLLRDNILLFNIFIYKIE